MDPNGGKMPIGDDGHPDALAKYAHMLAVGDNSKGTAEAADHLVRAKSEELWHGPARSVSPEVHLGGKVWRAFRSALIRTLH